MNILLGCIREFDNSQYLDDDIFNIFVLYTLILIKMPTKYFKWEKLDLT